ncbi:hypothetical protein [Pseudomonas syringae]|uniref:hypothetical protein n=1 Tax=Pseudomonas syringae TaxID=317 RepID=UPI000A8A7CEB|nr:hypothetical protein [Pseudomonas syringae]
MSYFFKMTGREGMVPCGICRGGSAEIICPDCDGRGYGADVEGNYEDCDRCYGDGYLPPDECENCLDGFVEQDDCSNAPDED